MSGSVIWTCWIGSGCLLLGGMAIFLWWVVGDRAKGRKRCPKCWYDMRGSPGLTCSECGGTVDGERGLLKTRRSWRVFLVGVFLLFLSGGAGVTPVLRGVNWVAHAPTAYLLYRMPSVNNNRHPIYRELNQRLPSFSKTYITVENYPPWFQGWRGRWMVRQCRRTLDLDRTWGSCKFALTLLDRLGPNAAPAIPEIISVIKKGETGRDRTALRVLESIGPGARSAVPALINYVEKENARKHKPNLVLALKSLGAIGPDARAAAPILVHFLDDGFTDDFWDKFLGAEIIKTLIKINPPPDDILPALMRHVHTGTIHSRNAALRAIWHFGADEPEAKAFFFVALKQALRDDDRKVCLLALGTVDSLNSYDEEIISLIQHLANEEDPLVQKQAKMILQLIAGRSGAQHPPKGTSSFDDHD